MLVTVAICTRDRAPDLAETLTALADMTVDPAIAWEVLVVDNGSQAGLPEPGDTQRTAESFRDRLPLRVVHAARPGLSHARNHAVAEARGDYICWTDDDVTVGRDWITAYVEAFRRHPHDVVFGGPITATLVGPFAGHADRWSVAGACALRPTMGERAIGQGDGDLPWGANYAVRTDAQRRHAYDPALGKAPGQPRLGEETDMIRRMLRAGGTGHWVPDAAVRHRIGPARQTIIALRDHCRAAGETASYLHQRDGAADAPAEKLRVLAAAHGAYLKLGEWGHRGAVLLWRAMGRSGRAIDHLGALELYRGILAHRRQGPGHEPGQGR
jgi:hypothetical protein